MWLRPTAAGILLEFQFIASVQSVFVQLCCRGCSYLDW